MSHEMTTAQKLKRIRIMAKEVIKHGKNVNGDPHETTCNSCGCKFKFEREDCYWDRPLLTYIVECPECGEDCWVGDIYD